MNVQSKGDSGKRTLTFAFTALIVCLFYFIEAADLELKLDSINWRHLLIYKITHGQLFGVTKETLITLLGKPTSIGGPIEKEHIIYELDGKYQDFLVMPAVVNYNWNRSGVDIWTMENKGENPGGTNLWEFDLRDNQVNRCSRSTQGIRYNNLDLWFTRMLLSVH